MSMASRHAVFDYTFANAARGLAQAVRFAMGVQDQPFVAALRPRVKQHTVVIVQRRLTHYRVPLFEQLRHRLHANGINLRLIIGDPTPKERRNNDEGFIDWAVHVPCNYFWNGHICWQNFQEQTRNAALVVVTQENKQFLNHFLILKNRRFKLAFWGHGANLQSNCPSGIKERFKRWTISKVDWWFAYTEISANLVTTAGFPRNRVTVLNNAVDTVDLTQQRKLVTPEETLALRQSLGFASGPVCVFIGSLYANKRLDFLFTVAKAIRCKIPAFNLLILGDGPDHDMVQACCATYPWIRWVGARFGKEKAAYMSLAHLLLNPGLVGLNILDSFFFAVPMITTDCGNHGPEISYLEHGVNGLMTANDLNAYTDACVGLMLDSKALNVLQAGCLASADEYTIDNMVNRFTEGISDCLAKPFYHGKGDM
jgi:glycosyltransferase involved in cell wall biosynthesis